MSPSQGEGRRFKSGPLLTNMKNMFEPEHKSKWYILLILGIASLIGWSAYKQYRPYIVQTSCSEVAERSSNFLYKNNADFDPTFSYQNVKKKCLVESETQ